MTSWQKVYHSSNQWQAEIVKAVLEENFFFPVLINKQDSAYLQILGGEYEVYIRPEYVIEALKIIQDDLRFDS
jgi:hypothetical protein